MASPITFDAVHDYLVTAWGAATPLCFENEAFPTPDEPAAFLFVEIFGSVYDQASIGGGEVYTDNLWRERGQLYGHVLIPNGTGSRPGRVLAQTFVDLFRGQDLGPISFKGASIGAGQPGDQDGNYYRMTATIDWERDE